MMRGLAFDLLIKILLLVALFVVVWMIFQSAFASGKGVLNSSLDWFNSKTGISFNREVSDVKALSFNDISNGADLQLELNKKRHNDVIVEVHAKNKLVMTNTIAPDSAEQTFSETLPPDGPAVLYDVYIKSKDKNSNVRTDRQSRVLIIDPSKMESGTAGGLIDQISEGIMDGETSSGDFEYRMRIVLDALQNACNIPNTCGDPNRADINGVTKNSNAGPVMLSVLKKSCYTGDPNPVTCPGSKAPLTDWLFCLAYGPTSSSLKEGYDIRINAPIYQGTSCTPAEAAQAVVASDPDTRDPPTCFGSFMGGQPSDFARSMDCKGGIKVRFI